MRLPKQNLTLNETPELTEVQQQTLRAAVNRSIPPDDYPGALEAGVGHYLARQFEGDLAPKLYLYCDGLDGLEAHTVFDLLKGVDEQRLPTPNFEDGVKNQRGP